MLWLVVLVLCAVLFYVKFVKPLSYWERRSVVHEKSLPLLGVHGAPILGKKSLQEAMRDIYYKHENESFVGYFLFNQPVLLIKDLDLIKQITVRDSDSFINRQGLFDISLDPILQKALFFQNGSEWKDMRVTLSPSFTANKMKLLFGLLTECGETFTDYFLKKSTNKIAIEAKDTFSRVTMDMIATCAFGVTCDSMKDKNSEFYIMAKRASVLSNFKFLFFSSFATVVKILKLRLIAKSIADYFGDVIKRTIKIRENNNTVRPDMLHLLIQAKQGKLKHDDEPSKEKNFAEVDEALIHTTSKTIVTDDDIVAQAFIFFLGGFDTVSTMCSYTAYELATNMHIQERLQREVDETLNKCNGKLTYEALMEMHYLDMVISESLRKWPPMEQIIRTCVKEYTLHGKNSKQVKVEVGVPVIISAYCIHTDPKFYPNPDVFDPERFSLENRSKIQSFSYLPFGAGPRNCIGSRFSLLAGKVLFVHILSKFSFKILERTQVPLKLSKKSFNLLPERGIWLGIEKRPV